MFSEDAPKTSPSFVVKVRMHSSCNFGLEPRTACSRQSTKTSPSEFSCLWIFNERPSPSDWKTNSIRSQSIISSSMSRNTIAESSARQVVCQKGAALSAVVLLFCGKSPSSLSQAAPLPAGNSAPPTMLTLEVRVVVDQHSIGRPEFDDQSRGFSPGTVPDPPGCFHTTEGPSHERQY